VPKPWTPFQYCSFGGLSSTAALEERIEPALAALKEKMHYLRKMLSKTANLHLKFDHPDQALQQAVYSRADRRIGPALLEIGCGRASFKQALRQQGINPWQYAVRPRHEQERMCWEVVDHSIRPGYLWEEYARALQGRPTRPCEPALCRRCGVCHEVR
jgi:hypothetical protein